MHDLSTMGPSSVCLCVRACVLLYQTLDSWFITLPVLIFYIGVKKSELFIEILCFHFQVYEMGEEVEKHHLMREDLVLELQALRERMLTVENVSENLDEANSDIEEIMKDQLLR